MDGLSITNPEKYRKIWYVLSDKGVKKDFLDVAETIPYSSNIADTTSPTAEDELSAKELKSTITEVLSTLTPREERVLRMRFGIGVEEATSEKISEEYSVTRGRILQIQGKALRKLKHPSCARKLRSFLAA